MMKRQTLLRIAPALLVATLTNCGASGYTANQANGAGTVANSTLAKLSLSSEAFNDGQPIPAQYTCDGSGRSPALRWSNPPAGTKSFALVVEDPDAPGGTFGHWGVFDIPASARSIGGGQSIGNEVTNDFGKSGYGPPCPPEGHRHHYHFKLFALSAGGLGIGSNAKVIDVENAVRSKSIAEGELIGTYDRK
jgi:Raf kinase inhibitor-like YbhB/YbcL family protein